MKEQQKEIEAFKKFASDKLTTHRNELNTRYENEKIDTDTIDKAYDEHRKILAQELKEKSDTLLSGIENPWLKEEVNRLSETFIQQLSPKN